jgi:DNA-binding NtrC family response regulator
MPAGNSYAFVADRHSIAMITLADEMFREMRRALMPAFLVKMACTEEQIKDLIDDPNVHGIVLDLECIGDGAADAIEVLQEIHRLRNDLVLVAITESTASELPLQATQAGADHFFLKPENGALKAGDGEQLRALLLQTIENRALHMKGSGCCNRWRTDLPFTG